MIAAFNIKQQQYETTTPTYHIRSSMLIANYRAKPLRQRQTEAYSI